mgnify:CR=1 FL=1
MNHIPQLLDKIDALVSHHIPFYAYGDNEAACELASRLEQIWAENRVLRALLEDRGLLNDNPDTSPGDDAIVS